MTDNFLAKKIKTCYPQALAKLIFRYQDVMLAEDLLHEAITKALVHWRKNMPSNGVAWLIKVAKNQFIDQQRKLSRFSGIDAISEPSYQCDLSEQALLASYKDDLLRLIFTCCHPALNMQTQITLTLKHVLGLSVLDISNALVQKEKTIEQRLTRAKRKISQAKILYQIPSEQEWPVRIDAVLKVIYLYFNEGYFTSQREKLVDAWVCKSAIRLVRMLHECVRENAEVIGLLALLLHLSARFPARINENNQLVILEEQNRSLWQKTEINEANVLVEKALLIGGGTPYAIQAAIAALHNNATSFDATDWQQIYALYLKLLVLQDNPVIELNAEVARAKFTSNATAILRIENLQPKLKHYRHYHTCLAGLYLQENEREKASFHYHNALKFSQNSVEVEFILQQIERCR